MEKLDQELELPKGVRIHFTGCPNSCGQAQVGIISVLASVDLGAECSTVCR